MDKYRKTPFGVSLLSGLFFLLASPALAQEIEWIEIPGTYVAESESAFGVEYSSSIGANTIVRRGNAINFDFLDGAEATYARVAGNCRTGWVGVVASGYYGDDGQLVINDRTQQSIDPRYDEPRLGLRLACFRQR